MALTDMRPEHIRRIQDLIKQKEYKMAEEYRDHFADAIAYSIGGRGGNAHGGPVNVGDRVYGSGGAGGAGQVRTPEPDYMRMLAMRMRWHEGMGPPGFDWLVCKELSPESIAIIGIRKGEVVTLKDDANMFPSDTLIGQLRILIG